MISIFSLTNIDRTIYENIRLVLVSLGHLPDITQFNNTTQYQAAKQVIKGSAKALINIHGTGVAESRDKKQSHTIIINRKVITPTNIGGGTEHFEANKNNAGETSSFTKKKYPQKSTNISYEVRIITNSMKIERLLTGIIFSSLGYHKSLKVMDGNSLGLKTVQCIFGGTVNVTSTDFTERIFNYNLVDVWLDDTEEVLNTEVPILTDIELNIKGNAPDTSEVRLDIR